MKRQLGNRPGLSAVALAATFCFALLISSSISTRADDVSGVIRGYVGDANNHPLAGALVSLRSDDGPVAVRTVSNSGFFVFLAVLPGQYKVVAERHDFQVCSAELTIYPNQTGWVRFRLPLEYRTISHRPWMPADCHWH